MRTFWFASAAACGLLASTGAWAQVAQTPGTTGAVPSNGSLNSSPGVPPVAPAGAKPQPAPEAPAALSEVVVTAQRRSENSQRAAVAVDVVSGADLISSGVTQPSGLSAKVPALSAVAAAGGNIFFVRGVGNFTVTANSDPAIAFNYDGVYVGRPSSTNGTFYDLDRVEVLKGPQGTLYGRNATGGAINVLPTQPKYGVFGGYATASYGNYDAKTFEGAVNVPLGDAAAFRLSTNDIDRSGYLRDGSNDEKTQAARAQIKADLTPDLTVRLGADFAHLGGTGFGVTYIETASYNPATRSYTTLPSGVDREEGLYSAASNAYRVTLPAGSAGRLLSPVAEPYYPQQYRDSDFYGVNAEIDYKTPLGVLTIVPAWRFDTFNQTGDGPGFPVYQFEKDDQYSVEARLAGTVLEKLDYNVGFFSYDEVNKVHLSVNQSSTEIYQDYKSSTTSYAGFGRLTAHLTDRLRLVGGIRYTSEEKSFNGALDALVIACTQRVNGALSCPNAPLFNLTPSLAAQTLPVPPANGAPRPLVGTGAVLIHQGFSTDTSLDESRVTYRGAVEYDLLPNSLLYGSVETGFRSGGFTLAVGFDTFQPEYVTAYTVGLKNRFFDRRLQLNFEGFYWDYTNEQVAHLGTDAAGNSVNLTQNVGASKLGGFEIEARALVTPKTIVSADLQYLHTAFSSFVYQVPVGSAPPRVGCAVAVNPANTGQYNVDCSKFPAYYSPTWTLNLGVEQTFDVGGQQIVASVDTQFKTSYYVGFEYLPSELVSPRWLTNAQLSWTPRGASWTVSVYARNLEDNRTFTYTPTANNGAFVVGYTGPPRTYGVRVATKF